MLDRLACVVSTRSINVEVVMARLNFILCLLEEAFRGDETRRARIIHARHEGIKLFLECIYWAKRAYAPCLPEAILENLRND